MKKFKRFVLALVLGMVLSVSMASCGQVGTEKPSGGSDAGIQVTEVPEVTEPTATQELTATSEPTATQEPTATPAPTTTPEPTATPLPAPEDVHTSGVMREGMTAKQFASEMGVGINLGNTFEAYWEDTKNKTTGAQTIGFNKPSSYETCWGAVVTTEATIEGMKSAGFQTVRIPVYWGNMMANDCTFTINTEYIQRVEEVVNYCLKNGLYVIINIHHYDGFLIKNYTEDEAVEAVETLWTQIARYFINYSDYVIFEGFNESLGNVKDGVSYTDAQKFAYVNRMNQTFVDAVRATGGNNANRLLIASGYWTNIDLTTSDLYQVPVDTVEDRIMVSVHYVDNVMYWSNKIGSQEWWDYSVAQCELLKKAFTDKGYEVFIGECTAIYGDDRFAKNATVTTSSECLEKMLNLVTDYGFVPVLWDVHGNFYCRINHAIKSETDSEVIQRIAEKLN
ncbi:MAG: glycoside hydrolase family 5 protein [Lachnospiraceae bacterium]|nr:glycoside hydrolase family 5 protein [Lachnospiraceae bacterium]